MEERTRALEAATQQSATAINKKPTSSPQLRRFHSHIATSATTTCECCNENHKIYQLQSFKALSVQDRAQLIKKPPTRSRNEKMLGTFHYQEEIRNAVLI